MDFHQQHFEELSGTSLHKSHPAFMSSEPWGSDQLLLDIMELVDREIESTPNDVDSLSSRLAPLLIDLNKAKAIKCHDPDYVRLYLSFRMSLACVSAGRWSRAYEWLLCGLSDLLWKPLPQGESTSFDFDPDRLQFFFEDERLIATGDSRRTVLNWTGTLLYYSWKEGGLREIVENMLELVTHLLVQASQNLTGPDQDDAIRALCHLQSWLSRNERSGDATSLTLVLEALASAETTSNHSIKAISLQLSCRSGEGSTRPQHEWAEIALKNPTSLTGHEKLQLLVNRSTQSDARSGYEDVFQATIAYSTEVAQSATDVPAFNYAQARLFEIIRPFIGRLIKEGCPGLVLELVQAWYCVPQELRRISPVIAYIPNFPEHAVYTDGKNNFEYARDTDSINRLCEIQNLSLGTCNTVADDKHMQIHTPKRAGEPDYSYANDFEKELVRFYVLEQLSKDHSLNPLNATAMLPVQSLCHPIQALMERHLGTSWPLVSSYQEPQRNRTIKKVMVWTAETISGPFEAEAVSSIFENAAIDVTVSTENISPSQFAEFYEDSQYDAIWINAHGEFSGPDPHDAYIRLSANGHRINVADLVKLNLPSHQRRLLFLNICDGGNVMATDAPPRLGIAPLLASRHQAVISHLWPAKMFVAAAFGTLLASRLASGSEFFAAFQEALRSLRLERADALALLENIVPTPEMIIERVRNGSDDFTGLNILHWGSPVFYE